MSTNQKIALALLVGFGVAAAGWYMFRAPAAAPVSGDGGLLGGGGGGYGGLVGGIGGAATAIGVAIADAAGNGK